MLSCGCSRRYKNAEAEIGNKYGRLTIFDIDWDRTKAEYSSGKQLGVFYKCKCECGNIRTYRLNSIKFGHIKSCGCSKFNNPLTIEDLTGKTFGRLTVIGRDIMRDKNEKGVHWLCKCNCGNQNLCSVTGYQLKSGRTQSCGCYASEQITKRNKKFSTKHNIIKEKDATTILFDADNNQCIIDTEDYPVIKNWYWRKNEKRGELSKGYWITNSKEDDGYDKSVIPLHQIVAEIKYGKYDDEKYMPDHLSRDTNDNRKCNICLKSNQDNCKNRGLSKANSSGKTGVSFSKDNQKWVAYITINYQTQFLGYYKTKEEAIQVRKDAEAKYGFTCDDNVAPYDTETGNNVVKESA